MSAKKKPYLAIFIIAIVLIGVGLIVARSAKTDQASQTGVSSGDSQNEATVAKASNYKDYSAEEISGAPEDSKVVVFFHAPWCPTCAVLNENISDNLEDIPDDVLILKADFDSETELKRKYDVRAQHALVQVDNRGEKIDLWYNSTTLSHLLTQIQ